MNFQCSNKNSVRIFLLKPVNSTKTIFELYSYISVHSNKQMTDSCLKFTAILNMSQSLSSPLRHRNFNNFELQSRVGRLSRYIKNNQFTLKIENNFVNHICVNNFKESRSLCLINGTVIEVSILVFISLCLCLSVRNNYRFIHGQCSCEE